jgi:hypothetical protein
MSRKKILVILVASALALVATGAFAQAFSVSYLDGTVELNTTKGWSALAIGDQVAADASIRISQSGSLELLRGQTKITILKDGTYDMTALVKAATQGAATATGSGLTKKLAAIVTQKQTGGTVGGVRGAAQGTSGDVTWVDESDETRTQVQTLLDQKKYTDALKVLSQASADTTSTMDTNELGYLTSVAYYGAGQTARAYKTLTKVTADPNSDWYARYIILKSQVLVDTQNYKDASAVLDPFITAYPTGEATQMAFLLSYYAKKGLGDAAGAKAALDAGYKIDPSTDTAKLIDTQRKAP